MSWEWNGRGAAACQHGYPHGDCPLVCSDCGHRCELHDPKGACQASECPCAGWLEDNGDDDEIGARE